MCGIAGVWDISSNSLPLERMADIARRFQDSLSSRGPDGRGVWESEENGVLLTHNRLSVIDIGPGGAQPMRSASGRYVTTYNGEIYNYRELKQELSARGEMFRSQSDTEVILQAIESWGIQGALRRFNGMFALAVWDSSEKKLYLARDPFGIKPLYTGWVSGTLAFASDARALKRAFPELRVDTEAVQRFLHYGFVPEPHSILQNVRKVPPGAVLCYARKGAAPSVGFVPAHEPIDVSPAAEVSEYRYWSYAHEVENGLRNTNVLSLEAATETLHDVLKAAVARQSVSDVPIGAFISGGIDSSTVVALLQAQSRQPVRTYTIGLNDAGLDESGFAREVCKRLGTAHTDLMLSEAEAVAAAQSMGAVHDEPFADSSQIATFLVSRLAARDVKVVLSGDGGDEIFGGYNRHVHGVSIWTFIQCLPPGSREAVSRLSSSPGIEWLDMLAQRIFGGFVPALKHRTFASFRGKVARIASARTIEELHDKLMSLREDMEGADLIRAAPASGDPVRQMMYLDTARYLPGDILTKVDRAAMACSLEVRVPLLDVEVARFAATLPTRMLVAGQTGKIILRRVLEKYIPAEWMRRPKMGFAVPLEKWLKGPMRDWAADTVRSAAHAFPDVHNWPSAIQEMEIFLKGEGASSERVWTHVMLAEWLRS